MSHEPSIHGTLRSIWPRPLDPTAGDHRIVAAIRAEAEEIFDVPEGQLKEGTERLRATVAGGVEMDSSRVLVSAFALVCEAARRTIGIDYYDVQLLAGLALARRSIAEMQTGEGKTFVAALPAYVFALGRQGVHVMTVNAYLAERDYRLLAPLYELLGVSVGSIRREASPEEKRAAYQCDITYGPGYEFGFDYLRDQAALLARGEPALGESILGMLHGRAPGQVLSIQRGQELAIVDEIDSVLIDEASSPLILSETSRRLTAHAGIYVDAMRLANTLDAERDYIVDPALRSVRLTEGGEQKAGRWLRDRSDRVLQRPWSAYVEQALRARLLLKRDVDYVVNDDRILLVDEATGRIFADRSLRQGLHQAIEVKEGVPVTNEQRPLTRISRQRYFRLYQGICGMTGTATGNEREFWTLYRLPVVRIPRRTPCRRDARPPRFFTDQDAKWTALAASVAQTHGTGQPVLVGTRTIDASVELARRFDAMGVSYDLLNGTQDAAEADVIARAGRAGAVTIATNMAGRGTDIKLGTGAAARGGLHVVVSEPHDSTRVDRQLIGRSARQSDPGSYQRFFAADDPLICHHASTLAHRMRRLAGRGGETTKDFSAAVQRAQHTAERIGYARRRQLLAQDKWLEEVLSQLVEER